MRAVEVFFDDELVELLGKEPELLAVADAIAETQPRRLWRSWLPRVGIAAGAAAAAVGLLVAAPWQSGHAPSLVDRALAAVGTGPVVHAVIETETGMTSIDLASGREKPVLGTMEVWFDQDRRIEHTLSRIDGQLQDDRLQTPTGVTALWGAVPGGPAPVLDPALAKSVDGYSKALASGDAKVLGDDSINGRPVTWLQLAPGQWGSERVAIDKLTSEPVRVETSWNGGRSWAYDVSSIQSLPEGSGDFTLPVPSTAPQPQAFMREPTPIAPEKAPTIVPGALALDAAFRGLPLTQVFETKLSTLFEPNAKREPIVSHGVEFQYGSESLRNGQPYLWLQEATQANPQLGWRLSLEPSPGELLVGPQAGPISAQVGSTGLMIENGIYISILANDPQLMLDAARALGRFSASTS
jgi:hypothetical protein